MTARGLVVTGRSGGNVHPMWRSDGDTRVFDRLWRGGDALATAGSGIGLAIAAEFIRAHQGRIELASQPGSGSTFTAILPLASGQAA